MANNQTQPSIISSITSNQFKNKVQRLYNEFCYIGQRRPDWNLIRNNTDDFTHPFSLNNPIYFGENVVNLLYLGNYHGETLGNRYHILCEHITEKEVQKINNILLKRNESPITMTTLLAFLANQRKIIQQQQQQKQKTNLSKIVLKSENQQIANNINNYQCHYGSKQENKGFENENNTTNTTLKDTEKSFDEMVLTETMKKGGKKEKNQSVDEKKMENDRSDLMDEKKQIHTMEDDAIYSEKDTNGDDDDDFDFFNSTKPNNTKNKKKTRKTKKKKDIVGQGGGFMIGALPAKYYENGPVRDEYGNLIYKQVTILELNGHFKAGLAPFKSRKDYVKWFNLWCGWFNDEKLVIIDANIFLLYFSFLRTICKYKPTTIRSRFSAIRCLLQIFHNVWIDLKKGEFLLCQKWLKNNETGYQQQQAPIFSIQDLKYLYDIWTTLNKWFYYILCAFVAYYARFRACEYLRLYWEKMEILWTKTKNGSNQRNIKWTYKKAKGRGLNDVDATFCIDDPKVVNMILFWRQCGLSKTGGKGRVFKQWRYIGGKWQFHNQNQGYSFFTSELYPAIARDLLNKKDWKGYSGHSMCRTAGTVFASSGIYI